MPMVTTPIQFLQKPRFRQFHSSPFNTTKSNLTSDSTTVNHEANVCLYCDYIYLDTDERRRFAQTSHEYLIEQVQTSKSNVIAKGCVTKVPLHFNHPVKELVWEFGTGMLKD